MSASKQLSCNHLQLCGVETCKVSINASDLKINAHLLNFEKVLNSENYYFEWTDYIYVCPYPWLWYPKLFTTCYLCTACCKQVAIDQQGFVFSCMCTTLRHCVLYYTKGSPHQHSVPKLISLFHWYICI